jgi:hypothetical protein
MWMLQCPIQSKLSYLSIFLKGLTKVIKHFSARIKIRTQAYLNMKQQY